MKKTILLFAVLFTATCISAQTDTASVTTVTTIGSASIYDILWNWVSSHAWYSIVVTIAVIANEIIPLIPTKWIPGNNISQAIWGTIKRIVSLFASKQTK